MKPDTTTMKPVFSLKPTRRGFRILMDGLTACAALLLLFAISVPNLLRSRNAANQRVTGLAAPDEDRYPLPAASLKDAEKSAVGSMNGRVAAAPENMAAGIPRPATDEITGPMIVRTASLSVVVKDFDQGRAARGGPRRAAHGYAADLHRPPPPPERRG